MTYVLQPDVPPPTHPRNAGRTPKYPFRAMRVGDSFEFAASEADRVRSAASYFVIRNPEYRFATQKQDGGKCRIWRVEANAKGS